MNNPTGKAFEERVEAAAQAMWMDMRAAQDEMEMTRAEGRSASCWGIIFKINAALQQTA